MEEVAWKNTFNTGSGPIIKLLTVRRKQQIVQVPITNAEQVGDDAVAGYSLIRSGHKKTFTPNIPQLRTNVSITVGSTPYVPTLPSSGWLARK